MSIFCGVSPLNQTDPAPSVPVPGLPGAFEMLAPTRGLAADQDRQRRIDLIIAWRGRLAAKYRFQLGEELDWDEYSHFSESEQPSPEAILMLAYVAAVLDQKRSEEARALRRLPPPSYLEMIPLLMEARRRGFAGSFPQWSVDARYWFPFHRNMVIEEENWRGTVERYGSVFHLQDEMVRLRSFIAAADPSAAASPANRPPPDDDVLIAAWQASSSMIRLARVAVARRLPMWTDGWG